MLTRKRKRLVCQSDCNTPVTSRIDNNRFNKRLKTEIDQATNKKHFEISDKENIPITNQYDKPRELSKIRAASPYPFGKKMLTRKGKKLLELFNADPANNNETLVIDNISTATPTNKNLNIFAKTEKTTASGSKAHKHYETPNSTKMRNTFIIENSPTNGQQSLKKRLDEKKKQDDLKNETFKVNDTKPYLSFDDINTDDESDNEKTRSYPRWATKYKKQAKLQSYVNLELCDIFFSSTPIRIHAKTLFPHSDGRRLKRNRNTVWND